MLLAKLFKCNFSVNAVLQINNQLLLCMCGFTCECLHKPMKQMGKL